MPSVLKAFRVLCSCTDVSGDFSCVILFHRLFIMDCKIYYNLMRWNMLGKPFVICLYVGKPQVLSKLLVTVWRMWVSRSFAPYLAKVCLCFALVALVILATTHWLCVRSCLTFSAFVLKVIAVGPISSTYAHSLPRLFRVPELLSLLVFWAWMNSTTMLWKCWCSSYARPQLTEDMLLISDLLLTGRQTPSKGLNRSKHDAFILTVTD